MVIISSDGQQQPKQARGRKGKAVAAAGLEPQFKPRRRAKAPAEDGERLVAPTITPADSEQEEQSLRPKRLVDYIGQASLKDFLDIAIQAAQKRNEPLDHMLLYGPPGLGKTSMASVLATEMGVNIRITSAPALERPRDIAGILIALKPHDILFIDEIHRLNHMAEEILYPAMEDFSLDIMLGKGKTARIQRLPLQRFTLIGATTKAGALSSPLRDRFGHTYRVEFYRPEELEQVITRSATILKVPVTPEGAGVIAGRARGTPRIANRLLKRVRDYAQVKSDGTITADIARAALDLFRIDERGLDVTDRQFLKVLIDNYDGGPVGIETMALAVSEDVGTIEDVYEPYLIQAGLLARTPRGRVATKFAYAHLGYGLFGGAEQQGLGIGT